MAVVVEDGTGVPGANSYGVNIDVDVLLAFFFGADISHPWFTANNAAKDAAIQAAALYLDLSFNYQGNRFSCEQGLEFPRCGICLDGCFLLPEELPDNLLYAWALLSAQNIVKPLFGAPTQQAIASTGVTKRVVKIARLNWEKLTPKGKSEQLTLTEIVAGAIPILQNILDPLLVPLSYGKMSRN